MKKKLVGLLLTALMSVSLFAGCSTDTTEEPKDDGGKVVENSDDEEEPQEESDDIKIGYVCKDLSQTWFISVSDQLKKTAESLGAEVILADAAMDPEKYLTAVDNMIAQEVDVLIVCPPDQQLSQITVDKCDQAGVKVFADADGLIDENGLHIAPALELNAYVVGESQGEWVGNYIVDNGLADKDDFKYLCLTMDTVSSCVPRAEGAVDKILEKVTSMSEGDILKADYDGTSETAYDAVAATVTANPNIKYWVLTAPNEEGAQGAARALEASGVDKDAMVSGLGGYLAKDEFKKDYSCFKSSGYFMASEDGEVIAKAAVAWAKDGTVPFTEYIKDGEEFGVYPLGATMVDSSNYKEVMGADAN